VQKLASICALALGIGTGTAIFSVADAVLLHPLPYKDPDRLVIIRRDMPRLGVSDDPFSAADLEDLRKGTTDVFEAVEAMGTSTERTVIEGATSKPEEIHWAQATQGFLEMFSGTLALGHDFDHIPDPPKAWNTLRVIDEIISNGYWRRRLGAAPDAIGTVVPGGQSWLRLKVVGVLAPGFELILPKRLNLDRNPDTWLLISPAGRDGDRKRADLRVFGRLRPGITLSRAAEATERVAKDLRAQFAWKEDGGEQFTPVPIARYAVEEVRPAVLALLGAGMLLYLIASANAVGLMLLRVSTSQRERNVRAALGGSRWRIVQSLLKQAAFLATGGTILGGLIASAAIPALVHLAPVNFPRLNSAHFDRHSIVFGLAAGLFSYGLLALAAVIGSWRFDLASLTAGRRASDPRSHLSVRSTIVIAQVTLTFVLLNGSGLLLRTAWELSRLEPGFDAHGLLTFNWSFGESKLAPPTRMAVMHDAISSLPGVEAVTAARVLPFDGAFYAIAWGLGLESKDGGGLQRVADYYVVFPGYFETMRTRLIAGRTFSREDGIARRVVIVDDIFASKAFPNGDAVGRNIIVVNQPAEIVGVVAHEKIASLGEVSREQIYFPSGKQWVLEQWAVRSRSEAASTVRAVQQAVEEIEPGTVVTSFTSMETLVDRSTGPSRYALWLISSLAAVGALLAALGIYGVLEAAVRGRTQEIGIRMALGATPRTIFSSIQTGGLKLCVIGLVSGAILASLTTRYLASLLTGVNALDISSFAGAAIAFLGITAFAGWVPAHRAASIDVFRALKNEWILR
jgi:macrolide transport system ATP-binding/permease protein